MKKVILFIYLFCLSLLLFAQMPTNGLVAYYKFDGNAQDASANNNHGTMLNGAHCAGVKDRFGRVGKAIRFDGINDMVWVNNSPSLTIATNEITVAFWVYIENYLPAPCAAPTTKYAGIFAKGGNAITDGYSLELEPTAGRANVNFVSNNVTGNPPTLAQIPIPTLTKNKWVHFAMAFKNNVFALYKNGNLIALVPAIVNPLGGGGLNLNSPAPLILGDHPWGCDDFLKGRLDDFVIYDRALTPAEIGKIRNAHTRYMMGRGNLAHKKAGDPVDVVTGAYTHKEQDLSFSESNMNVPFIRSYTSAEADIDGQFGYGWRHSLEYHLDKSDSSVWVVTYAEGGESYHIPDSVQTTFEPMYASSHDSLYINGGNYVLENSRDKTKLIFDSNGNIVSVQDINNNAYIYGATS